MDRSQCAEAAARYVEHDAVWAALSGGESDAERDVRLIRLSWLMALGTPGTRVHAEFGGVLRRRQDLPEAAFIGIDELRAMERRGSRGFNGNDWFFSVRENVATPEQNIKTFYSAARHWKRNVDDLLPIIALS